MGKSQKKSYDEITDERFARIKTDPRFKAPPKNIQKLQVDDRFSSMFTDKKFRGPIPDKVDERGRPITEVENPIASLYDVDESQCIDQKGNFKWDVQSSSEEELDLNEEELANADLWQEQEEAPMGDATYRIAVMNCDWRAIKAVDLLMLFRSFCPEGGRVEKVTIYPSDFGMQRMKTEEVEGPTYISSYPENLSTEDKIRLYEKDQLKYYYAVVECDSAATAEQIYEECDDLEIERTSNKLDLRFIPDSLTDFPYKPKEEATEVPKNYTMKDFFTRALQHSKVNITWDETPIDRSYTLNKAFVEEDLDNLDLKNYLATPSESDNEELDLQLDTKQGFNKVTQFKRMRNDDVDLEITFNSAFDSIAQKATEEEIDETVWEKQLRKKSEKKQERKREHKKKLKEAASDRRAQKEKAYLELLVNPKDKTSEDFKFNPEDSRFTDLYSNPAFGIDPTSTQYKRDADGNKAVLQTLSKKRKVEE
jgi:hypothetical protein